MNNNNMKFNVGEYMLFWDVVIDKVVIKFKKDLKGFDCLYKIFDDVKVVRFLYVLNIINDRIGKY